jgi:hypothetical protein
MMSQDIDTVANLINAIVPWLITAANPKIGPLVSYLHLFVGANDIGSLIAGMLHGSELASGFSFYISCAEMLAQADCDPYALIHAFNIINTQHDLFLQCAVSPGFDVEGDRGEISPIPVSIAQVLVPLLVIQLRYRIESVATNQFLLNCPDNVARRWVVAANTTSVASVLNLTAPSDPPLRLDPRAWVPATSAPQLVPFAHLQILPNMVVQIDVAIPSSTASIHISADRSMFPSEAVAALSVNSASSNSSFSMGTAFALPGTNISIFSIIIFLTPSTIPTSEGDYLFQPTGVNTSFASYLNQSSVFNKDYNILFKSFNLSITYDPSHVPAGMDMSAITIIDLVAGVKVHSSQVDVPSNRVAASAVVGYGGAWGGGGVYALGY